MKRGGIRIEIIFMRNFDAKLTVLTGQVDYVVNEIVKFIQKLFFFCLWKWADSHPIC